MDVKLRIAQPYLLLSLFSNEGYWMVEGETELIIGQPSKEGDSNG